MGQKVDPRTRPSLVPGAVPSTATPAPMPGVAQQNPWAQFMAPSPADEALKNSIAGYYNQAGRSRNTESPRNVNTPGFAEFFAGKPPSHVELTPGQTIGLDATRNVNMPEQRQAGAILASPPPVPTSSPSGAIPVADRMMADNRQWAEMQRPVQGPVGTQVPNTFTPQGQAQQDMWRILAQYGDAPAPGSPGGELGPPMPTGMDVVPPADSMPPAVPFPTLGSATIPGINQPTPPAPVGPQAGLPPLRKPSSQNPWLDFFDELVGGVRPATSIPF